MTKKLYLRTVMIYVGHPSQLASLRGDETQKGDVLEVTWTFDPGDKPWVECLYDDTTAVLAAQLSEKTARCVGRFEWMRGQRRYHVKSLECYER